MRDRPIFMPPELGNSDQYDVYITNVENPNKNKHVAGEVLTGDAVLVFKSENIPFEEENRFLSCGSKEWRPLKIMGGQNLSPPNAEAYQLLGSFNIYELTALLQHLSKQNKLKRLVFQIKLTTVQMRVICRYLPKCKSLQNVNFTHCGITDELLKMVVPALLECPNLKVIDFGENALTGKSQELILKLLTNLPLERFCLTSNLIGDECGRSILQASFSKCRHLKSLDLVSCGLTDRALSAITQDVRDPIPLKQLSLALNPIGPNGAKALACVLIHPMSTIESLLLFGCDLKDQGAKYIGQALKISETSLVQIALSLNGITDDGVRFIVQALGKNHTLRDLYLAANSINSQSAIDLCKAVVARHAPLRVLSLSSNSIGDEAASSIIEAVRFAGVTYFTLYNNRFTDKGGQVLLQGLEEMRDTDKNFPIDYFYIFGNPMSSLLLSKISALMGHKSDSNVHSMLHTLCRYGRLDRIKEMLKNPQCQPLLVIPNKEGKIPSEVAEEYGYEKIAHYLKQLSRDHLSCY